MKATLLIFCIILIFPSCNVHYYPKGTMSDYRYDTIRFEKNSKPLCKDIVMYDGDTIKKVRIFCSDVIRTPVSLSCVTEPIDYCFNCNDTIIIHIEDIEKKYRKCKPFDNNKLNYDISSRYGAYPFTNKEAYFENNITHEPLTGLCKIIYNEKKYTIGYFYYGHPFLPTLGLVPENYNIMEYYYNNKYSYYSLSVPYMPIEHIVKKKGNKIIIIEYNWEIEQKHIKKTYKIKTDNLFLVKRKYYPNYLKKLRTTQEQSKY